MEDEELTQNNESEKSAEDLALEALLGTATDMVPEKESPEPSETVDQEKESKKQRDFEKAFFKSEARRKEVEAKLAELQTPANPAPAELTDEAVKSFIKQSVVEALGDVGDRGDAVREIKQRPYFSVLESKILEIKDTLPQGLSDREKLDQAYKIAAGENIDLIVETALKVGQDSVRKNREFKANLGGIRETPSVQPSGTKQDQLDRYQRGTLSEAEYRELREDGTLEEFDKQQLGI